MENTKIAEIVERLRLREERRESLKKHRKVCFEDKKPVKVEFEEVCIFKAQKLKKRAEDWTDDQLEKPDIFNLVVNGIKNHYIDDLQVRFGKICFKCPAILLTCFSNVFKNYDENMVFNLQAYNIKPKGFAIVYQWMLTEAVNCCPGFRDISQDNVLEMLHASKKLLITHLEDQCWYFLQKTARCDEKSAFELYNASEYNLKEIQQLMLSRICKYFLTLVASEDFLKLETDEVCTLLSLNTLGVNSEIEVFYSAIMWLNYLWTDRKGADSLNKIMNCVRFNLMPSWFLVSLDEGTGYEQIDRVTSKPRVLHMITEGIIFTASQLSYLTTTQMHVSSPNLKTKLQLPLPRRWIYDKSCPYHFRPNLEKMDYVTFEMFTDYLKSLREYGEDYWRTLDYLTADHCNRVWKSRPVLKNKK